MATTSPDNIWTPDLPDFYTPTVDLAAMADTIQDALNANKTYRVGTSTQRLSLTPFEGLIFFETNTKARWLYSNGAWSLFGIGPFKTVYLQSNNSGTVTSTSFAAPSGLSFSTTVNAPVACRAKVTFSFQGWGTTVNDNFTAGIRLSGATTVAPVTATPQVIRFTSVSSTIQPLTLSNSFIVSLNAGNTTFQLQTVREGAGTGTRTIRTPGLIIEPVSE